MINRVLIRIKLIQILYAYYKGGIDSVSDAQKELNDSFNKSQELYYSLLILLPELPLYAKNRMEIAKSKYLPTQEDLNPNRRFVDNLFISQIASSLEIEAIRKKMFFTWEDHQEVVKAIAEALFESDLYREYMSANVCDYESDKAFARQLFKQFIYRNPLIDDVLEEACIYWNDDREIVESFVIKSLKKITEDKPLSTVLLPQFNDPEDRQYAIDLLHNTINMQEQTRELIHTSIKNWDMERMAFFDILVMQMALTEILTCPNIPNSVTLNEYIEIAKHYSTNKSGIFVNGILDVLIKRLKQDGKLPESK